MKVTKEELCRFGDIKPEILDDAIRSGIVFKTLSDAQDLGEDLRKVKDFKRYLEWKKEKNRPKA